MELMIPPGRLDRPVDHGKDHVLGPADAEIMLVGYGGHACSHNDMDVVPIFQDITDSVLRILPSRTPAR